MATTNLGLATIMQSDPVSPDPINGNFEKVDALGRCYVTASGSSGIWRYRCWSDGTYECWGTYEESTASPDEGGDSKQFSINYPVTFAAAPQLLVSARQDGNLDSHVGYVERNQSSANWYVLGLKPSADIICYLYAIGRVS